MTKLTEATFFHPAGYFDSYNQSDIVHILGNIYPELKIFQETAHEPAGSEGAKFRLWVKSKGLSLEPGERTAREGEGEESQTKKKHHHPKLFLKSAANPDRSRHITSFPRAGAAISQKAVI